MGTSLYKKPKRYLLSKKHAAIILYKYNHLLNLKYITLSARIRTIKEVINRSKKVEIINIYLPLFLEA